MPFSLATAETADTVRLIDENANMLGIMPIADALKMASEKNLDLVRINNTETPPVCKLANFSKLKFASLQKQKTSKKKSKSIKSKEIKIRPFISQHDYTVKVNKVKEFLEHGHRVKISIRLKGREIIYKDKAFKMMTDLADSLEQLGKINSPAKLEGDNINMLIVAKTQK